MRIALLEDDPHIGPLMVLWLNEAGHDCQLYSTGRAFTTGLSRESFDLLILDWVLPDTTGEEVVVWVREKVDWHIPVIFVTVRNTEEYIVRGLEAGADDYMSKPVRHAELLARVKALAKRSSGNLGEGPTVLEAEPYYIDCASRTITRSGQPIELTTKEFDLSVFLFRNNGRTLSRAHIMKSVWGQDSELSTRTVDTHVSRLRAKLGLQPEHGWRLTGIYHYGYRLENIKDAEGKV